MKSQFHQSAIEVIYISTKLHLEWYRIFLHTAHAGNLTKAAQELHVTQPSVSYAIKQLEEGLGVKLFDRLSKGVVLTPEGADLMKFVEQSLSLLDAGERKMASLRNRASGELRIGSSGPMIKHLLLPPLDKLRDETPNLEIRLHQGKTAQIASWLKENRIDIGIVHLPMNDPELDIRQLAAIQDCFVAGPRYRQLAERPLSAAELAKLPLLLLSSGSSTRQFAERWFAAHGLAVDAAFELNSSDMLVEFARRGYGAAFLTRAFVRQQLEDGELFELRAAEAIPERRIGLATRRGMSLPVIAQYFVQLLTEQV
ncbi:LysR family transcriptional regulator [Paenibacillus rhizovicinus]|uniref:LysR family transcriptional regulator n=1 Tax=Paenibacillus rhizovicinus TaxID=2704463 RepID=A0A6C0P0Q1_9BACL|nr:LysR family transcriptional regulator [Paenibacillus rhizovicinus]QHW32037.1 LysR family transcriptional regulator [Paenibacillus rhizovicinus]